MFPTTAPYDIVKKGFYEKTQEYLYFAAIIIMAASCTQYRIVPYPFPPSGGGVDNQLIATDSASLLEAIKTASDGDTIEARNVVLTTADASISISKNIALKGNISLISSTEGNLTTGIETFNTDERAGTLSLFRLISNAAVDFSGLTISVSTSAAGEMANIINVESGSIKAIGLSITATDNIAITGIYIGSSIPASAVVIVSSAISVKIDADNAEATDIADTIADNNDNAVASLPYDVGEGTDANTLQTVLEEYGKARLTADLNLSDFLIEDGASNTIYLNEYTLSIEKSSSIVIAAASSVSFENGTINITNPTGASNNANFMIGANSTFTIDNVTLNASGSAIFPTAEGVTVIVKNGSVVNSAGAYSIATNAMNPPSAVTVIVEDSMLNANGGTAICANIDMDLTIRNSTLTGTHVTVLVRGGTAEISDSIITSKGTFETDLRFDGSKWSQGTYVAYATLVIGDTSAMNYNYPANVSLKNVTLDMSRTDASQNQAKRLFLASDGTYPTTLTTDNPDHLTWIQDNNLGGYWGSDCSVTVNGTTTLLDNNTENIAP